MIATATALLGAVVAGALTTMAPCSLTLLPVIVGGSVSGAMPSGRPWLRPLVVAGSLGGSVIAFTLLLRASTALIGIPAEVWRWLSGGLLVALGVLALFPDLWDRVSVTSGLNARSAGALARSRARSGLGGAILTGLALGPVFTSCSPLYGYVVVTVLPADLGRGLALLLAYAVGLVGVLLAVALLGSSLVQRLRWASDPHTPWRRAIGALFVVLGLLIATGAMQDLETWLVDNSPVRPWEWGPA